MASNKNVYKADKDGNFKFVFEFDRGRNNMTTNDWVFLNVLDFQPDWELQENDEVVDIG